MQELHFQVRQHSNETAMFLCLCHCDGGGGGGGFCARMYVRTFGEFVVLSYLSLRGIL